MNLSFFIASISTPIAAEQTTQNEISGMFNNIEHIKNMAIDYAPKLIAAFLIYFIGKWAIARISQIIIKLLKKRKLDHSLHKFAASIVKVSLMLLLFLTIISVLGVDVTSFAALLAGAGLAIGGALNGTLGNFAGGVMILILKPFRVGDLIEAQNSFGIVQEIGLVDTTVLTSQNKTIHIPNGPLSTGTITNYTDQENLRIDIKLPVWDGTDFEFMQKIAMEAMLSHPKVLKDPAPTARITDLTSDGPMIVLWPRIKITPFDPKNPRQAEADYYSVFFGVRELVYRAFTENGIKTPDWTLDVTHSTQK